MQDNTFEIRLEIADMMWEVDRLKELEQEYVAEELYEKAAVILERQKRLTRLINNKEKKLKKYEESFSTDART
jgi:hypothetical protein